MKKVRREMDGGGCKEGGVFSVSSVPSASRQDVVLDLTDFFTQRTFVRSLHRVDNASHAAIWYCAPMFCRVVPSLLACQ